MINLIPGIFSRVLRVRIEGEINQQMSNQIFRSIQTSFLIKPEAIMLTINSAGGSLTQAKNIAHYLRNYGNKHNIPIYSFAEDQCLGTANLLLTIGVKNYAYPMSLIGDVGYVWKKIWFQKFADKYNVKQEFLAAGQNKVKFNPFQDLKPESQKWMKNYLFLKEHELKSTIINNRSQHFTKLNMDKAGVEQKVFSVGILDGDAALKVGLIDGVSTFDEVLKDKFGSKEVKEVNKKSGKGRRWSIL